MRDVKLFVSCLFFIVTYAVSSILPIVETLPDVERDYDQILQNTWDGIKARNIDA